ncbi:MAG: hypothetical protein J5741_06680 [Bacteroidales bacterium]|nr:hypothetical protein [Bacteroidales bacterium]
MRLRVFILLWVCLVAGGILYAQESPYINHDITTRLQPMPSVSSNMLNELQNIYIGDHILKIEETQNRQINPKYDLNSYILVSRNKKYSKNILYTATPKINTTFSYDSMGKVVSINQEVVKTTYFQKVKTKQFLPKNDNPTRLVRGPIQSARHSLKKPTCQSSQRIYNRFTFENGLPILWEQKNEAQSDWQRIEALRYDSLQRIIKVYHFSANILSAITTYTYDADNRIVTEKMLPFSLGQDVSPIHHKQYLYDDSLQNVQVVDLLSDSVSYYSEDNCNFTSQYDSEGRLQMIEGENLASYNRYPNRCCSISTLIKKVTFRYDDHGALTEKCYYTGGEMMLYRLAWKYKYDERGNWVQCKHYEDDHILNVTNRTIVYP